MITTARFARENNIPYLGICPGMQVALIDYARHVANMENANSTEFVPDCKYPVVALITEWRDENGNVEVRSGRAISAVPCVSAHSSASWLTIAGSPAVQCADNC